jgi:hypothetical protein
VPKQYLVFAFGLLILAPFLVLACASKQKKRPYQAPEYAHSEETIRVVIVSCAYEPPEFDCPETWPDQDKLGNVMIHASTKDRIDRCINTMRGYIRESREYCDHVRAEEEKKLARQLH